MTTALLWHSVQAIPNFEGPNDGKNEVQVTKKITQADYHWVIIRDYFERYHAEVSDCQNYAKYYKGKRDLSVGHKLVYHASESNKPYYHVK